MTIHMDQMTVVPRTPAAGSEFDLDVSIVEAGDAVNALLCRTDNGCDTQKDGDC